ncbi:MAG: hypothetical protein D3909_05550 [Candidatus Electrothrix sp. ATG1]|nr:hypothetical protein [Candidatus Electrothrix sp. ATG1]
MLGLLTNAENVGIYRVVVQSALVVVFGMKVADMAVQPYFARLHSQGDYYRLQRLVTLSSYAILIIAFPVVLTFVFFGEPILLFLYGEPYRAGTTALTILALGQLVHASIGPAGVLLTMTGHERHMARAAAIVAVLNVAFNFILIPHFGMNGAASATAITLATYKTILFFYIRQRLGINCTALSKIK